jgi:hypothetical protein
MVERLHEKITEFTDDYLAERMAAGWRLVAAEWERDAPDSAFGRPLRREEVPYGLRVSDDCMHLEENPDEVECLTAMMELVVLDEPISKIASGMNAKGLRDRKGQLWTAVSVYRMLPRLIDTGPHILSPEDWAERRQKILQGV